MRLAEQIVSLSGAVLVLFAFASQQLGRMPAATVRYQLLNLLGGTCLFLGALASRNFGFILLEGTWAVASAYGLWNVIQQRK